MSVLWVRFVSLVAVIFAFAPASIASSLYELESDLSDRARFKSFGQKTWATIDPLELSRGQPVPDLSDWTGAGAGSDVKQILTLIAFAEAGAKGYDAIHYGARKQPKAAPTQLRIKDIQAWVRATPGQPHAIGRYQFIPKTFNRLVRHLKLAGTTRFDAQTQDLMASVLLEEAGLSAWQRGELRQERFMDALAKIWAGLPTRNGKSYYHGYAKNRATITRSFYSAEMKKIR